jgi:hypothetical protein
MDIDLGLSIGNRYSIVTMIVRRQFVLLNSDTDGLEAIRHLYYLRLPGEYRHAKAGTFYLAFISWLVSCSMIRSATHTNPL